jgi:ATP-dependent helicase/nuclease subunit A
MNTVVVAGAGAGKTYALVQEYVSALFGFHESKDRVHPSQILAVTFTEKAAAEMRSRVTSKLLQLAHDNVFDDWIIERAQLFGVDLPTPFELRSMSHSILSAPICTFHSFCSQIIREHAAAAEIDPEFSLLAPLDENEIALDMAEAVVIDALNEGVENVDCLVTRFQLRKFGDSKGLCDNLVSLYQQLSEHGMSPLQVQSALIMNNKTLAEDKEMDRLIGQVKMVIRQFHQTKLTGNALLRVEQFEAVLQFFLSMLHQKDDLEVKLSAAYKEMRACVAGRFGNDELRQSLVKAIVSLGSYLCFVLTTKDAKTICFLLERFFERFDAYKTHFAVLGFGDLLKRARLLLRNNLNVRQKIQNRFRRILVDEFQDTSPLQEDLVALLCEDPKQAIALLPHERAMSKVFLKKDILFVVGDPKQSIYGFRGADVQLFNHTLSIVTKGSPHQAATGQRTTLQLCRRSQGSVVELVNLVGHATLASVSDGVTFSSEDCLAALKPALGIAGAIWKADILPQHHRENAMADVLAAKVRKLILDENAALEDIVVLVRRVKSALPIVLALQRFGVSARIHGGEGFFGRTEIVDILAALKLAVDEDDELATLTVLRSPFVAMSDSDLVLVLDSMLEWKGGVHFSQVLAALKNAKVAEDVQLRMMNFASLIKRLRVQLGEISVAQAIDRLLEEGQYSLAIAIEDDADDRLANVLKLRSMCIAFLGDGVKKIRQLWERLDNPPKESLAENLDIEANAVRLMTIHQSKGLEYRFVVLADTLSTNPNEADDIGFSPHVGLAVTNKGRPIAACAPQTQDEKQYAPTPIDLVRQSKKKASESELARLLYVALTRAKERIFFMDVQVDGKNLIDRGINLRHLFYRGRDLDPQRFDEIMPTEIIKPYAILGSPLEKNTSKPYLFFEQPALKNRITASQTFSYPTILQEKVDAAKTSTAKMGSLAHQLIASVGTQMTKATSSEEVSILLQATARRLGLSSLDAEVSLIMEACQKTLNGFVLELLKENYFLQFEAAIYLEQDSSVLEGVADLVAFHTSKCLIVDFKSSAFTAKSEATRLQLSAYAVALQPRLSVPIFFAACVIGETFHLHSSNASPGLNVFDA